MPTRTGDTAPAFASRLPRRNAPVWGTFWGNLFLLAFTCFLLWPLCVGRSLYWGDIMLYFAPMLHFQQAVLQHGHIPLWNPAIAGGQPLVGNPQMGVFYPTTPLLLILPVWLYLSVTTIAHVFLCGAFMNAYLRGWSEDRWARLAGSLTYMGSECIIGRIQFPPMIFSAPYFPLLLLCIDRCLDAENASCTISRALPDSSSAGNCSSSCSVCHSLRCRRTKERIRLSLTVGLLTLAAHPQMAYLILAAGSLYAAARLFNSAQRQRADKQPTLRSGLKTLKNALPSAIRLLGASLLGLMLASAQVLPAIQVLLESPREKLTPAQANRFYLEPAHLLRLIFPRFWGHPASADFWGGGNAWEPAFFIGWLPLLFIGLACIRLIKQRYVQFWLMVAVVGIWLAFGMGGGLYWIVFKTIPGLSNFHDPARFLIFTTFSFAVLTTLGWKIGEKTVGEKIGIGQNVLRGTAMLGIIVPLWWVGKDWNPTVPHEFFQFRSRALPDTNASKVSAKNSVKNGVNNNEDSVNNEDSTERGANEKDKNISQRLYMPAPEQFWKHYVTDGYSDYGPGDARHYQAILDTRMPNLNMETGQESASGYEPVPLSAPASVDALGRIALRRGEPNLSRLLAIMGVRELLLPQADNICDTRLIPVTHWQFQRLKNARSTQKPIRLPVRAWQNVDVLPRVWIVRCVRRVEGKLRVSAALAASDFDPERIALLQDGYNDSDTYKNKQEPSLEWPVRKKITDTPRIVVLDAHNLEVEADCGSEPGFMVISATAFPGWQAAVDTKPVPLHRVDGSLMGVYLTAGKHSIALRYKPACYQVGLYLSLLAAAILSAMTGYVGVQRLK